MSRKRTVEDLSVDELRRLLVEKRRLVRQERLERFRKTGRIVTLVPDEEGIRFDELRSEPILDEEEEKPQKGKKIFDYFLLSIEVLAVIGLVFILYNGLEVIQQLNQEVAQALEQPTLTPTPIIQAVVLPSGHTPPNAPEGAQPNESEIPEHLRPLVQYIAQIPIPTVGPQQAVRIQIPAIGVDAPVVQGDGWEQLKKGVGQHIGTADPGDKGNLVLSAHNDIFGEIFRYLDRLEPGDEIIVYTNQRSYRYLVSSVKIVEPTQVEFLESAERPSITLISCYPYMVDNQRIVVQGYLTNEN